MHEIQVDNILLHAKTLKLITEDTLAKKVLEIDINAESSKNQDLLLRLIRSLEQYVNKEQTLMYIGFVGHYSSGKSSTINNLLALNSGLDKRNTGLNPTDKAITLITDTQNSNALILMNREGNHVPVRTSLIHNKHLSRLVIADTPGSGDPQVVNEMIQDFLPICDYVFYFISAANPIDQADLPLLKQKTDKLPFIPTIFIVTRTDEFRINKMLPLVNENIDFAKKDQFTGQLISRIKELIQYEEITPESFMFIDNEFNYGIPELQEKLNNWSTNIESEELVKIHGYKVEYYKANLDSIYSYFDTSIKDKIKQSKEFLKTANENIVRFDKSIELNNEKLRLLWSKSELNFKQTLGEEKLLLDEISNVPYQSNILLDREIQTLKKTISQSLESQATGHFGKIILDLNGYLKQKLREEKYIIFENINRGELLSEDIAHLLPGRISFAFPYHNLEIDFAKINDHAKSYSEGINRIISEVKQNFRSKTFLFKSHTAKEMLVKSIIKLYSQGEVNINENFEQYFEKIQMYRGAVLTRNTKETIEKLRIGTQLDELDDDFSEEFMAEMKSKAIKEVYFLNAPLVNEFQASTASANAELEIQKQEIDKIAIPYSLTHNILAREDVDITQLTEILIDKAEQIANTDYQNNLDTVLNTHTKNYRAYLESLSKIQLHKKRSILKWSILAGFIFVSAYLGLRFSNTLKPSTIIMDVIIGLIITLIGNFIGYLFGVFKTDAKKITAITKKQFVEKERLELLRLFGEDFWDDVSKKLTEPKTELNYVFLKDIFSRKCDPILNLLTIERQEILNKLIALNIETTQILGNHKTNLNNFYNKHYVIFSDHEKNLDKIGHITKHIKETAIKPSFDLLNETTENLENVKMQIGSVR